MCVLLLLFLSSAFTQIQTQSSGVGVFLHHQHFSRQRRFRQRHPHVGCPPPPSFAATCGTTSLSHRRTLPLLCRCPGTISTQGTSPHLASTKAPSGNCATCPTAVRCAVLAPPLALRSCDSPPPPPLFCIGLVASGSWDKTIKLWDHRASTTLTQTVPQPDRVYSMDVAANRLVVAHANNSVHVFDTRNMAVPEHTSVSQLKAQTRCVRCFADGVGYAISSVDGRVAIEYLPAADGTVKKPFAFKCHRRKVADVDHVYPVNALAFHPVFGTFATGGCDGYVCTWDPVNKRRIWQYHQYPTRCVCVCVAIYVRTGPRGGASPVYPRVRLSLWLCLCAALRRWTSTTTAPCWPSRRRTRTSRVKRSACRPACVLACCASRRPHRHPPHDPVIFFVRGSHPADSIYIRTVQDGEVKPKAKKKA